MKKADIEAMMQGRRDHLKKIGLDPFEVQMWSKNWSNLKSGAKRVGRVCTLTFEEYTDLAQMAGMTKAEQVDKRNDDDYQMGRIGDRGDYVWGNCRFITKRQNLTERWENERLGTAE